MMTARGSDPTWTIFTGPMFGSKTTQLIAAVERFKYQNKTVMVFKPRMDNRYEQDSIVTHMGSQLKAASVNSGEEILQMVRDSEKCDAVAIDEAFMIDGAADACLELFGSGVSIVIASIQLSASGLPFDEIKDMMPYATRIEVCPAVCPETGRDAYYTARKRSDLDEIAVGGSDLYAPTCWEVHPHMNKGS